MKAIHIHLFSDAYRQSKRLYETAFPPQQRYSHFGIWLMSKWKRPVEYLAYYDHNDYCGMTYTIDTGKYLYLFYIAVNPARRSRGCGSRMLAYLKEQHPDRMILLDVEEPDPGIENYDQRVKRIEFYRRNGFKLLDRYIKSEGQTLKIMATAEDFESAEYWKAFRLMDIKTLARVKKLKRILHLDRA